MFCGSYSAAFRLLRPGPFLLNKHLNPSPSPPTMLVLWLISLANVGSMATCST